MKISRYLDRLEGRGKRHVALIVTPKNEYPIQFLDDDFYSLEQSILENPKSYISIYEDDKNEIMQYVAFRLFLRPVICDKYSVMNKSTAKVKRLSEEEIISFFVAKHFYDTVPYGEKDEEDAINDGENIAKEFLKKYKFDKFEYASVEIRKDSDEANVLIKMNFQNNSSDYYFDYVYVR